MHVLFFIFTSFGKLWSLNTIILDDKYTKKAKRKNVDFLMVWYHIVSYQYRFVSIGIVSYRKKIKGTHPYLWIMNKYT